MREKIGGPMERVKGPVAFVCLNETAAGKIDRARVEAVWTSPLGEADIIDISRESRKLSEMTGELFEKYSGLIFVMASGIVLRVIAPHVNNKYDDPAVVIVDDQWRHAVSALSGHEGGANWLTYQVAKLTGSEPVISTGTETNKMLTLGIGCRRGVSEVEVMEAVESFMVQCGRKLSEIRQAASVELKKEEAGLTAAAETLGLPLVYFGKTEINQFDGEYCSSSASMRQLGIKAVCEPCALLAGRRSRLIKRKTVIGRVTLALAEET